MNATGLLHSRSLLLAVAIGVLAGAAMHSALKTPWLPLLLREYEAIDWLNASGGLERFFRVFNLSLVSAAIFSPILIWIAVIADRKAQRSLVSWLLFGMTSVLPMAFFAWFLANNPFDCFANCKHTVLRDLVAIVPVLVAGAFGALIAWLIRRRGTA